MYYAFFETGDKQFFSKLMRSFCSTYVQNIVDLYYAVKQKKSESNVLELEKYKLDWKDFEEHINDRKKDLDFFNCSQHLRTTDCLNDTCMAEHTTVLAKDQADELEGLIKDEKNSYCRKHYQGEKKKVWVEIQRMFQNHNIFEFFELKVLHFEEPNDPVKYLYAYIGEAKKMRPAPVDCAYVRSANTNSSGFADFKAELPDVVACDILQTV